ncbi:WD40 repeat domain-containing protein [Actinomadura harenae]|uniref:WD40 repeat domain-containing protein n=1 Tax=Actinomadura harenae TaxID=2483351 RepID=A0A3M2M5V2_9ACTN|nr:hypothetical protein [Actinomadura harenae]RMI44869.1 hypothetical protein EBO15_11330 [Actinomadura harenae]
MKITDTTGRAVLNALEAQDWAAFEPERDLLPLRTALNRLERDEGVGAAHRLATERIRERGALLRHPDVHRVEITAQALSPSGRYLAVGDFGGDDYDAGATLQIWEVATGRCVNVIDGIVGGIGWPGYGGTLQWSADETRLAVMYRSNNIGVWDPFGADVEPSETVRLTFNGRPDPFAFAPGGLRAYAMDDDSDTFGSIVGFPGLETTAVPALDHDEEEDYDEDEEVEDDEEGFVLQWPSWSRDEKRLYGGLRDGRLCSIDVASGEVSWIVQGDREHSQSPGVWNRDETRLAYRRGGELVIADAATGQDAAVCADVSPTGAYLSWGTRLAVILPAGHDSDRPRVAIVDPVGRHRHDLDVTVQSMGHDLMVPTWAWAPGGDRAAFLTADGRVEVWSMDDEGAGRVRAFDAPAKATGLLWGVDDVLVVIGPTVLRFMHAGTGEVVGDFTLLRQPPAPRPLLLDGEDHGEEMRPGPNPTFALDERTWAAAFPEGAVIAPPGREDDLTGVLAWAVDHRYAWPVHWGPLDVFPNASAAAAQGDGPLREKLEPFLGLDPDASAPEDGEWPPPGPSTVDDLFRAFHETVVEYGADSLPWTGAALHEAALLQARRGEPDGVRALVEASTGRRRPFTAAEAALVLASEGVPDGARSLLADHAAACEERWAEPVWYPAEQGSQARAAAAVGGAYALLGDQERADRWFRRAREALRDLHDGWDHRLPVVWALLECGREDEALALLDEGTGDPGDTAGVPFVAYLLRKGRVDLASRVLREAEDWFGEWTVMTLLRHHGQADLLREWAERNGLSPDEPDEDADLARRHAEIELIPPAQRQGPIADLLIRAAGRHRIDAVLALLPKLPMPSCDGLSSHERPYAALSALRIVTAGVDHETW